MPWTCNTWCQVSFILIVTVASEPISTFKLFGFLIHCLTTIILQVINKGHLFHDKQFSYNLFDVITKLRYIDSISLHVSKWVKCLLRWEQNVHYKIETLDADKYHLRQYSIECSKYWVLHFCYTIKFCHAANNLYW